MIIRLLNTADAAGARERRRMWLDLGQGVVIGPGLVMTLEQERRETDRRLVVALQSRHAQVQHPLGFGEAVDVSGWAGLLVIPRAAEMRPAGRFGQVLVEFVAVRDGVRFA